MVKEKIGLVDNPFLSEMGGETTVGAVLGAEDKVAVVNKL
jgi:hypothetical protein